MAQTVQIQTSMATKYASIIRAATAGAKACKEVGNDEQARKFIELKAWADSKFKAALEL